MGSAYRENVSASSGGHRGALAPSDIGMSLVQSPICMRCEQRTPLAVDAEHGLLRCPGCSAARAYSPLPLVLVTGASGSGKTTMAQNLRQLFGTAGHYAVIDTDLFLHMAQFGWSTWCNNWLLLAYGLAENGCVLVLCGAIDPRDLEDLPARQLVGGVHSLLLTCPAEVTALRLSERPPWRQWTAKRIGEQVAYARELGTRNYHSIDTGRLSPREAARRAAMWITESCAPRLCHSIPRAPADYLIGDVITQPAVNSTSCAQRSHVPLAELPVGITGHALLREEACLRAGTCLEQRAGRFSGKVFRYSQLD
jgi:energy-coupling factor transporter ATP-binding protein EcfA2